MLFSGCQNANEIDKRNFVMASGADKNEEGEIVFTVGCAVPNPDSDTNIKSITEKKTEMIFLFSCPKMKKIMDAIFILDT